MTKYHDQPCTNCGHDDRHSTIAGCTADMGKGYCPCVAYARRYEGAAEGQRRADEGAQAALNSGGFTMSDWRIKAAQALEGLVSSRREFTAEDVTAQAGVAPSPTAIGGMIRGLAQSGRIRAVGYTRATRREAHARPVRIWVGTGA